MQDDPIATKRTIGYFPHGFWSLEAAQDGDKLPAFRGDLDEFRVFDDVFDVRP